jgi:hypothetical protein
MSPTDLALHLAVYFGERLVQWPDWAAEFTRLAAPAEADAILTEIRRLSTLDAHSHLEPGGTPGLGLTGGLKRYTFRTGQVVTRLGPVWYDVGLDIEPIGKRDRRRHLDAILGQ